MISNVVIPAKAGIPVVKRFLRKWVTDWIPAFAGMTMAAMPLWSQPPQGAVEKLTLASSLERARSNNPRLLLAGKELSIAKTQLRQAKSLYYPKVNLNLDYVRYRNETVGITSP
jgi:outer membrane protein TolC